MKWLKVGAVIVVSVVITALGIDAADTFQGSRSTLFGQIISSSDGGGCPEGMISAPMAQTFSCVDIYEASASEECPHPNPKNEIESRENLESQKCAAVSSSEVLPWRFIAREQAQTACLRGGKRLPTASEWFLAAAGTPDLEGNCNIESSGLNKTGESKACVSAIGIIDAIGNVWEWTSGDVINGVHNGQTLPESGYVTQVDSSGVPILTNTGTPSDIFYQDYFWSSSEGYFGMLRGGYYNSQSDAGVYTVHAETLPTSAGTAIGFRCVQ